jgi:hypothetical protein
MLLSVEKEEGHHVRLFEAGFACVDAGLAHVRRSHDVANELEVANALRTWLHRLIGGRDRSAFAVIPRLRRKDGIHHASLPKAHGGLLEQLFGSDKRAEGWRWTQWEPFGQL